MGLKDRFTRAKPQDNEMVKRPESSNSGDSVSKTFTPRQLIPEGELDGLFIDKNSNRVDRGPPRQQIPENEIKHLLSGKIKAETKTKIEAPKTEVVKDQKPKEKKQPPIVKLLHLFQSFSPQYPSV